MIKILMKSEKLKINREKYRKNLLELTDLSGGNVGIRVCGKELYYLFNIFSFFSSKSFCVIMPWSSNSFKALSSSMYEIFVLVS